MKNESRQVQINEEWLDNPVFILSIGKTGTTLLISLFDGHPELLSIPEETDYFDTVHTPINILLKNPLISREKKIKKIIKLWTENTHIKLFNGVKREKSFATGNIDYSNIDFPKFKNDLYTFLNNGELDHSSVMKAIPYAYRNTLKTEINPKLWLEKTPFHIFNVNEKIPFLEQVFPNAKFIHLFRHPLDIYISYKKKHPHKWSIGKFAFDFKRNVAISKEKVGKDNHFLVRYEDVVVHPKATLSSLTQFLGVKYDETLLNPTKNGVAWHGNSVDAKKFTNISTSSVNKHLKYDKKDELAALENLLSTEMKYLDYESSYLDEPNPKKIDFQSYSKARQKEDNLKFNKYWIYHFVKNLV